MRTAWRRFCVALVSGLVAVACHADKACEPELHVAYDELGSYMYLDAGGAHAGIDPELITEIARRLGCKIVADVESNVRIMHRIESGTADIAGHKFVTPERQRVAVLIPYAQQHNVALVRKDLTSARTMAAFMLNKQLVAAVGRSWMHGDGYDDIVDSLRKQGRVLEVADVTELFQVFRAGRAQVIFTLPIVYQRVITGEELATRVDVQDWAPGAMPSQVCLMISRASVSAQRTQQIDDAVVAMRRDGTVRRILEKYVGVASAAQMSLPPD